MIVAKRWRAAPHVIATVSVLSAFGACLGVPSSPTEDFGNGLRAIAVSHIDSAGTRTLAVRLTIENLTDTAVVVLWGPDCLGNGPLAIQIERRTGVAWQSSLAGLGGCPVRAVVDTVPGNRVRDFSWRLPLTRIMGDSLRNGTYTITVEPTFTSPAIDLQVDAGTVPFVSTISAPLGDRTR